MLISTSLIARAEFFTNFEGLQQTPSKSKALQLCDLALNSCEQSINSKQELILAQEELIKKLAIQRNEAYDRLGEKFQPVSHSVLFVGYGIENGIKYWIIQNSYGPNWGDHGYFKIERGIDLIGSESMGDYFYINKVKR